MAAKPTLYLIDGSSYLFRAFHALPALSTSKEEPTGAMFGVANMIRALVREREPALIAVVFDAPGKTFRHRLYPEYKATRPPMPDDLRVQIQPLKDLLEAMGLPLLSVPDVEADDVIGTLVTRAREAGHEVVVSTSDKDLAQLVTPGVTLINTMSNTTLDEAGVEEKFGVRPERIIDYLALVGDSSDNVPGVPKCGPKTAAKWLAQYGDLDGVIAHADEVGGKVGENLRGALEKLPLSRELVTIKTDVDLDVKPEALERGQADEDRLRDLFTRFEFGTWLAEIGPAEAEADEARTEVEIIRDEAALERWLKALRAAGRFALDSETTSRDPMRAQLVGISFAHQAGKAAYVPLTHSGPDAGTQLPVETVLKGLKPLLEDPEIELIGQHFKYDAIVLARHGIQVPGWRFDTMLESYVLDAAGNRHDLDSLAARHLGRKTTTYEEVAGKGAKEIPFAEVAVDDAAAYAGEDAAVTLAVHQVLWPKLEADEPLKRVFQTIEMPLAPVLARMERRGVLVDDKLLNELSREFAERMSAIEAEAFEVAGREFNLGSPKQLQELLFEEQNLPVIRKTPKGQPSTAEDVLEQLARKYPLPRLIMDHRQLAKLKSTYTDKLPAQIDPDSGRIHTSYHQAVAATGRLSSNDPNLQNIPIRTAEGRRIREAFIARRGYRLLAADYSQIELRIMAHLSADEGLAKAFRDERDIHAATAAEVFGAELEDVTADQRRAAKAINFGLIYGMSAFGLGRQLDIERAQAQEYIDRYFSRYPGVKAYMKKTREKAHAKGFVETLYGRRLKLPNIGSRNYQQRQAAERAAINAPMQGTAADIIKRAMIEVDRWLENKYPDDALMLMQVHDELVLEVRSGMVEEVAAGIRKRMATAAELSVPLVVDIGHGSNWNEAH